MANDGHIYKMLYEELLEENKQLRKSSLETYLEKVKNDLGQDFWDFKDCLLVEELKNIISGLEDPTQDIHETPDNKAVNLSAMYTVLKYFLTYDEYKEYVTSRKLHKDDGDEGSSL